ncbi:MAG: RagB/SusD family nutrient uptake outer membrane protein [Bacteroides graminisolvens]
MVHTDVGTIANKNEAIKACLRERQIELAYEGKRFWDIWRWMLYTMTMLVITTIHLCYVRHFIFE